MGTYLGVDTCPGHYGACKGCFTFLTGKTEGGGDINLMAATSYMLIHVQSLLIIIHGAINSGLA